MSYQPSTLAELDELLSVLKASGVAEYVTPELTLRLAAQKAVEPEESFGDIQKRIRAQERAEAKRELEITFAHVPGGPPQDAIDAINAALPEPDESN